MNVDFEQKIALLQQQHEALLQRSNLPVEETNGIVCRYTYPIVTREHIPLEWRYDFNPATNPYCMERIGFNATMNSGAMKWNGKRIGCPCGRCRPEIFFCCSRESERH